MMRRTLHVGQLPSQMALKRRRLEQPEDVASNQDATTNTKEVGRPDTTTIDPTVKTAAVSSLSDIDSSVAPQAPTPANSRQQAQENDDDEASSDDEEELLREQQRLAKTKERAAAAQQQTSTSGVASYNSDVVFRRTTSAASAEANAKAQKKAALLRHSNLQASKDHKDFLTHYFK